MDSGRPKTSENGGGGSDATMSMRTNIMDELEKIFVEKRTECVTPQGFLYTPLHVVKQMAEAHNTRLHSEIYIIHHGGEIGGDRIYRVELMCGGARGIGQAPVKGLAVQLAAIDMIEKIKYYNKDQKLQIYGMPPGCRVHPHVLRDLMLLCKSNEITPKIEFRNSQEPFEKCELFECTITVGQLQLSVKSDCRHMARRLAAKEMYNAVSTIIYPDMVLAIGSDCVGLKRLKELGIRPLVSDAKKDWLMKYRITDGGKMAHYPDEEPDDGDMLEPEDLMSYVNVPPEN